MRVEQKVELLSYSPNPDQVVAMGARLCYSPASIDDLSARVRDQDQSKYLQRIIEMNHLSPVEHAGFTFGIEGVSRSLLAQITRHRIASFSVQSQRYVSKVDYEDVFPYVVPPAILALGAEAEEEFAQQMQTMQQWYNGWCEQLGEGAHEDARFVLPNACETKMVVTMNARELMHFFQLRCCNRAQWEIRALAWDMLKLVYAVAPKLFACAGPQCLRGPCQEGGMTCGKQGEVRDRRAEL